MLKLLRELLRTGEATAEYPFAPYPVTPNFRGKPEYAPRRCIACAACTNACPANALTMTTDPQAGTRTWMLNYGRCVFCARCEEVCPTGAIVLSSEFELAVGSRADLMVSAVFSLSSCRHCNKPFAPAKEVDYVIELFTRSGMPAQEAERRRELLETCPTCRREADVLRMGMQPVAQIARAMR